MSRWLTPANRHRITAVQPLRVIEAPLLAVLPASNELISSGGSDVFATDAAVVVLNAGYWQTSATVVKFLRLHPTGVS